MYKSELQANGSLGDAAIAFINGYHKAQIWEVKASELTNNIPGILVCVTSPQGEDESETYTSSSMQFYDLGEFIPSQTL